MLQIMKAGIQYAHPYVQDRGVVRAGSPRSDTAGVREGWNDAVVARSRDGVFAGDL